MWSVDIFVAKKKESGEEWQTMVDKLKLILNLNVNVLDEGQPGFVRERNEWAISGSRSPVICFIDSDVCKCSIDWLNMFTLAMMDGVGVVTPCIICREGEEKTIVSKVSTEYPHVLVTKRDVFESFGGFDDKYVSSNMDLEFVEWVHQKELSALRCGFSKYGLAGEGESSNDMAAFLEKHVVGYHQWMANLLTGISEADLWRGECDFSEKDIVAIIPYYNFLDDRSLMKNHLRQIDVFKNQGVETITVELTGWGNHCLPECGQTRVTGGVMWQKEALINHGASLSNHRIISWHDSGTILDDDWAHRTARMMSKFNVVQCFGRQLWLLEDLSIHGINLGFVKSFEKGKTSFGFGGSWAARRDLFYSGGLYDGCIVGGGDVAFAGLFYDGCESMSKCGMGTAHRRHYQNWLDSMRERVIRVGYVPGKWRHLWHGEYIKRKYRDRHEILKRWDFNPEVDLTVGENGALEWASGKNNLHKDVEGYFHWRK